MSARLSKARARSAGSRSPQASSERECASSASAKRPRARHHPRSAAQKRRANGGSLRSAWSIAAARLAASGSSSLEPLALAAGLQVRSRLFGEGEEVIAVAGAQRLLLAGLGQPLEPVLAHGLEQAVADLGVPLLGDHQRLVDQRAEQVEHVLALDRLAGADLLGRLEREAAGEDGQAAQQRPLVGRRAARGSSRPRRAGSVSARQWRCAARR